MKTLTRHSRNLADELKDLLNSWGINLDPAKVTHIIEVINANNSRKKLTDSQVRNIRRQAIQGTPTRELADTYGINRATVYRILQGDYH